MPRPAAHQLINALRSRFAEFGLVAPKGPAGLKLLENAMEAEATDLPGPVREIGAIHLARIVNLAEVIERRGAEREAAPEPDEELRRPCTIPGIGPVTAGAVAAFAPDLDTFDSGRTFAAWLGLVPRQRSTGGKTTLGAVSKMRQTDIRRLLLVGAMSAIRWAVRKGGSPNRWRTALVAGKPKTVAAVALANKMARMIRAVSTKQEDCRMARPEPDRAKARHARKAGASARRGAGDTDLDVHGRHIQTRGSSACRSLNRCEPRHPNSIPARGLIEDHIPRPDTHPTEDPADEPKITLAKQGGSTHGPGLRGLPHVGRRLALQKRGREDLIVRHRLARCRRLLVGGDVGRREPRRRPRQDPPGHHRRTWCTLSFLLGMDRRTATQRIGHSPIAGGPGSIAP